MEQNLDATGWHLRGSDIPELLAGETRQKGPFSRPPRGPRSLAVMALEHVVHNIRQVSVQHLQSLSSNSIQQLRMLLCSRGELSFDTWKKLLPFLPLMGSREDIRGGEWAFRGSWPWQSDSLHLFAGHLRSPTVAFLAHLRIIVRKGQNLDVARLMVLAAMPNLGMLEIAIDETAQTEAAIINDRLVRAWSLQPNAFPRLRLLQLWSSGLALTPACLPYAHQLSSLVVFDVGVGNYRRANWDNRAARTTSADLGWARFVSEYRRKHDSEEYREWVTELVEIVRGNSPQDQSTKELQDLNKIREQMKQMRDEALLQRETMKRSAPLWLYNFLSDYGSQDLYQDPAQPEQPAPPAQPAPPSPHLPMATLVLDNKFYLWFAPGKDTARVTFVRTKPPPPPVPSSVPDTSTAVAHGKRRADDSEQPRLRKARRGASAGDMLASFGGPRDG